MTDRDEGRTKAPERIWLQPACCATPDVGRLWCEDPDPVECEDGVPWTEYVRAEPSGDVGERGIGHTWPNPPGGRCLTCRTGWNTRQGEGKCPYPLEGRLQEIANRDEGVDMRLSPDLARWLLARLRRTPETERRRPVWQTGGWKEAVMEIVDPNEERPTAEVLEIVNAIADATARLADPNAGGEG